MLNKKIKIMISALAVTTMITSTVVMGVAKADTNTTDIATSTIGADTATVGTSSATTSIATGTVATSTESVGTGTVTVDNDYDIDITGKTLEEVDKERLAQKLIYSNTDILRNYNATLYINAKTENGIVVLVCGDNNSPWQQATADIPEEIGGHKVVALIDVRLFNAKRIIIPNSVTYISNNAFIGDIYTTELEIPSTVKSLESSFYFPRNLEYLTIHEGTSVAMYNQWGSYFLPGATHDSSSHPTIYTEEGSDAYNLAKLEGIPLVVLATGTPTTDTTTVSTVTPINVSTESATSTITSVNTVATDTTTIGTSTITDVATVTTTAIGNTSKTGDFSSLPIVLSSIAGIVGIGIFKKKE